jgi:hypothetical protein
MEGEGIVDDEVAHVHVVYVSSGINHICLGRIKGYPLILDFLVDVLLNLKLSPVIADIGRRS